jgi:hypothetical protein
VRAALALTASAVAVAAVGAGSAQATKAYGGQFFWGCTYSWGAACIEPHYQPKLETLLTMDADQAHYLLPGDETENRYPAARPDNVERCIAAAAWNGTQYQPWTSGYDLIVSGGGAVGGYGMIGTCAVYYNISLYQIADWGGEN